MDWTEAYEREAPLIFRWLLSRGASEACADDIVQQVFTAAIRANARPLRVRAYLFSSARREWFRRREREPKHASDDAAVSIAAPESGSLDEAECVDRALAALEPDLREVVVLRVWHELSFREIGELLEIPDNTAASRWRRAGERLRQLLGSPTFEESATQIDPSTPVVGVLSDDTTRNPGSDPRKTR